jgi:hypothetical protein
VGARAALAVRDAATIHIAVIDHWLRRVTQQTLPCCHDFALEALENDEFVHQAPAIVERQTPSALAQAASE